jgi:hydroxymethylpyrimidine kinase/phosphomethylpyrimidine kinase
MFKALTIAGSDSSGGAGIQADLKTFSAHKVYGMSVITAITAQNTCGVYAVQGIDKEIVEAQLDAVFTDIYPDSVKIGMLFNADIIRVVAKKLKQYNTKNIVLDTVMVSTSNHLLLENEAVKCLKNELMPHADIITPNIPEAEVLCGFKIHSKQDMIDAAKAISKLYNNYILIKGGHLHDCSDDLLYKNNNIHWFESKRIDTKNTHGTGCTLSSAIAANLAMKNTMFNSVKNAKDYVFGALSSNLNLGIGNGPLNHHYKS